MASPTDVFFCYASEDEALKERLEIHLKPLMQRYDLRFWDGQQILPGADADSESFARLEQAHLTLLLISADFLSSDHCISLTRRALKRRERERAHVIPILLKPCFWVETELRDLQPLPKNAVPVARWADQEDAWYEIASEIQEALPGLRPPPTDATPMYADARTRRLSSELLAALEEQRALRREGRATQDIDTHILTLQRLLREGGDLKAGDLLGGGRYLLLENVGRGGFGTVFKAKDLVVGDVVAVKALHSHLVGSLFDHDRFFRGASAMASLDHPTVVRIRQPHIEEDGCHYFVMDFIPGPNLERAVLEKRLSAEDSVPVILAVGDALARAHATGLIHRDVKPTNVLLDHSGRPYLTDFDLVMNANTTGGTRGEAIGTFLYAAPECLLDPEGVDARADVYALGMTALFCQVGTTLPRTAKVSPKGFLRGLQCNNAIRTVLEQAIAWDRGERFAGVAAFCDALRSAAAPKTPPIAPNLPMASVDLPRTVDSVASNPPVPARVVPAQHRDSVAPDSPQAIQRGAHAQIVAIVKVLAIVPWTTSGGYHESEQEMLEALMVAYEFTEAQADEIRRYASTRKTLDDLPLDELSDDDARLALQYVVIMGYSTGKTPAYDYFVEMARRLYVPEDEAEILISLAAARIKRFLNLS